MEAEHLASKQRIYQQNCQAGCESPSWLSLCSGEEAVCGRAPGQGSGLEDQGWGPGFAPHVLLNARVTS